MNASTTVAPPLNAMRSFRGEKIGALATTFEVSSSLAKNNSTNNSGEHWKMFRGHVSDLIGNKAPNGERKENAFTQHPKTTTMSPSWIMPSNTKNEKTTTTQATTDDKPRELLPDTPVDTPTKNTSSGGGPSGSLADKIALFGGPKATSRFKSAALACMAVRPNYFHGKNDTGSEQPQPESVPSVARHRYVPTMTPKSFLPSGRQTSQPRSTDGAEVVTVTNPDDLAENTKLETKNNSAPDSPSSDDKVGVIGVAQGIALFGGAASNKFKSAAMACMVRPKAAAAALYDAGKKNNGNAPSQQVATRTMPPSMVVATSPPAPQNVATAPWVNFGKFPTKGNILAVLSPKRKPKPTVVPDATTGVPRPWVAVSTRQPNFPVPPIPELPTTDNNVEPQWQPTTTSTGRVVSKIEQWKLKTATAAEKSKQGFQSSPTTSDTEIWFESDTSVETPLFSVSSECPELTPENANDKDNHKVNISGMSSIHSPATSKTSQPEWQGVSNCSVSHSHADNNNTIAYNSDEGEDSDDEDEDEDTIVSCSSYYSDSTVEDLTQPSIARYSMIVNDMKQQDHGIRSSVGSVFTKRSSVDSVLSEEALDLFLQQHYGDLAAQSPASKRHPRVSVSSVDSSSQETSSVRGSFSLGSGTFEKAGEPVHSKRSSRVRHRPSVVLFDSFDSEPKVEMVARKSDECRQPTVELQNPDASTEKLHDSANHVRDDCMITSFEEQYMLSRRRGRPDRRKSKSLEAMRGLSDRMQAYSATRDSGIGVQVGASKSTSPDVVKGEKATENDTKQSTVDSAPIVPASSCYSRKSVRGSFSLGTGTFHEAADPVNSRRSSRSTKPTNVISSGGPSLDIEHQDKSAATTRRESRVQFHNCADNNKSMEEKKKKTRDDDSVRDDCIFTSIDEQYRISRRRGRPDRRKSKSLDAMRGLADRLQAFQQK